MARKKAVTEPQEEEKQETAMEGMAVEGTEPAPDAPMDSGGAGPVPTGDGLDAADPGDFPDDGGIPYGDAAADDDAPRAMESGGEYGADGVSPGDGEGGVDAAPGDSLRAGEADEGYDAFLRAASEGGVETVPLSEAPPLLLGDAGDNDPLPMPQGGEADGMPSAGEAPSGAEPITDRPAFTRVVDRRTLPPQERERVLTIDPRAEVQTQEDLEDLVWHELENANRTRHILTGKLDSVGRTRNGMDVAVVLYKGVRVLVSLKEMMVHEGPVPSGPEYAVWLDRITRILHSRLDSDIDFVVRGIDVDSRTVVGSRRDAMYRKRRRFYLETDVQGHHLIEEGRVVQARVVAVADKLVRLEVFGVECNVVARGSSWMWVGSARDNHFVGELILVRVQKIERGNVDRIAIQVDPRSVFGEDGDNLSQCQPQCRYVGQVTGVRKGVIFVRLNIGVNAIAHSCLDMRMPGKKDTVSFTVTRLDEKLGIAIGIITRIIKQNL